MSIHNNYKKLFSYLPEHNISQEIVGKVMDRIEHTRIIRARIRGLFHITISIASVVAFISTINYILSEAYKSGFSEYASLFVSDTSYAFSNLKMISLSLIESMPIIGITLAFGILYVFGNSFKRFMTSLYGMRSHNEHSRYIHA